MAICIDFAGITVYIEEEVINQLLEKEFTDAINALAEE